MSRDLDLFKTPKTETVAVMTETRLRQDSSPPETRPRQDIAHFETSARRHQTFERFIVVVKGD